VQLTNETSGERFIRIGEPRTNAILDKLRLLGQCSNRNNYSYTNEQIQQIFQAIDKELRRVKTMFYESKGKIDSFELKR